MIKLLYKILAPLAAAALFSGVARADVSTLRSGVARADVSTLRSLAENFERLTPQQVAIHAARLDQTDFLRLSVQSAFGSLVHYQVCQVYPQAVMNLPGPTSCAETLQSWAQTLYFNGGNVAGATSYALQQRNHLLITLKCASGELDRASCGAYGAAWGAAGAGANETIGVISDNMGPSCTPGTYDSRGIYCYP